MLVTEFMPSSDMCRVLKGVSPDQPGYWYRRSASRLCSAAERIQAALRPVLFTKLNCATVRLPLHKAARTDVGPGDAAHA